MPSTDTKPELTAKASMTQPVSQPAVYVNGLKMSVSVRSHFTLFHIAHLPQQCHNSKCVIFQDRLLKILKCYNFLSATTTQLLSSGEFYKLPYDTIPVKSASANVSFYTSKSKISIFEL
jgi:hypothetical protein